MISPLLEYLDARLEKKVFFCSVGGQFSDLLEVLNCDISEEDGDLQFGSGKSLFHLFLINFGWCKCYFLGG
ncbi:hypothetical protein ACFX12_009779 [Malus domestica]